MCPIVGLARRACCRALSILELMSFTLSPTQIADYQQDGFLVLPGFKTAAELLDVRDRAEEIVAAFEPGEQVSIFSTHEQRRSADAYFLGSGDQIRCFFEEEAFDAAGQLRQAKALSINKIGHALHDRDPVFDAFSHGPALASVAAGLGLAQPQLWQSMYIFKQPGIGGEVGWHQDATFFETMPWPSGAQAQPLEVAAGTLVVFHGLLPHYSSPNRSPQSRHAYTLHVTDGQATYAAHNWLQRDGRLPLRGFA